MFKSALGKGYVMLVPRRVCVYIPGRVYVYIHIYIDTYIYTKPTTGPTPLTERPPPSAQARHATLKALKLEVLEKTAAAELGAQSQQGKN